MKTKLSQKDKEIKILKEEKKIAKEMLKKENLKLIKEVAKDSQIANYTARLKQKDKEIAKIFKELDNVTEPFAIGLKIINFKNYVKIKNKYLKQRRQNK